MSESGRWDGVATMVGCSVYICATSFYTRDIRKFQTKCYGLWTECILLLLVGNVGEVGPWRQYLKHLIMSSNKSEAFEHRKRLSKAQIYLRKQSCLYEENQSVKDRIPNYQGQNGCLAISFSSS